MIRLVNLTTVHTDFCVETEDYEVIGLVDCTLSPAFLNRKEVIQPHLPVRLPCYDFTPLTRHTFGTVPLYRLD